MDKQCYIPRKEFPSLQGYPAEAVRREKLEAHNDNPTKNITYKTKQLQVVTWFHNIGRNFRDAVRETVYYRGFILGAP